MLDLGRPESGLTLRKLAVIVGSLPPEAGIWHAVQAAQEKANKPRVEKIRERQEHYTRLREQQEAEEASQ